MRISSAVPLLLLAGALGACGPAYRVSAAEPVAAEPAVQARQQSQRYTGVWALVDSANNLFNVRLLPDGWTDALLMGPSGPQQWSWEPGADRLQPPSNYGKAVRLDGALAAVVGVYSFQPAQTGLPPYTASLLSNGLAFNTIDQRSGGAWRLEAGRVVIDWISGWRTSFAPRDQGLLSVSHWQPGADRAAAPMAARPGNGLD